jgi:hypothetical protein
MNSYEQKQEQRRDRLTAAADAQRNKAQAHLRIGFGGEEVTRIPLGQPILVGHHSEGRHRRHLERLESHARKGVEALKDAERLEQAAAAVGTAGVSSDDPDAIIKLKSELADAEQRHQSLKDRRKVNKNDVAAYELTNSGARIRSMKKRIEELEKSRSEQTTEFRVGAVTIIDDVEANRTKFIADRRPSTDVTDKLKSHGFRWSPSTGAWQRHRSAAALYWAKQVAQSLIPPAPTTSDATEPERIST